LQRWSSLPMGCSHISKRRSRLFSPSWPFAPQALPVAQNTLQEPSY